MAVVEKRLSDAISAPLITAYRAGGLGLSILVLGALLMFGGGLLGAGATRLGMMAAGFVVILVPCYFFYVREVRPLHAAERAVDRNSEIVNAVQDSAIALTELAQELQALAFKHADEVTRMIDTVKPIISSVPLLRGVAEHPAIVSTADMAQSIVSVTQQTRQVVNDVQAALITSDATALRGYVEKLQRASQQVSGLLAAPLKHHPAERA